MRRAAAVLLVALVLGGCPTEPEKVFECGCRREYRDRHTGELDSITRVVFDTLPTATDCQEAGRRICPTLP